MSSRLHDILAGCCAAVVTLIVIHNLTATSDQSANATSAERQTRDVKTTEVTALIPLPPDLGVPGEQEFDPEPWQPAGVTSQPASAPAPPSPEVPSPEVRSRDVETTAPAELEVSKAPEVVFDAKPAEDDSLSPLTPTDDWRAIARTFPWDLSPPSEVSPLPAREMSAEQLRSTVEEYERWVHRGQITLRVDCSLLDDDHLDSICALYVLCSKRSFVAVQPGGGPRQLEPQDIPSDKLIGDLPRDRSRWPKAVTEAAYRSFGPGHSAHVVMLISDATALEIYRALAKQIGADSPRASQSIYMRLRPVAGHVRCEVVPR